MTIKSERQSRQAYREVPATAALVWLVRALRAAHVLFSMESKVEQQFNGAAAMPETDGRSTVAAHQVDADAMTAFDRCRVLAHCRYGKLFAKLGLQVNDFGLHMMVNEPLPAEVETMEDEELRSKWVFNERWGWTRVHG